MNWLSASGLGFLSPLWLLLAPLGAAALVYAYKRRGTGQRIIVGTLFLLKNLKRPSFSRKQFRPPPRFYFELLVLLALAVAAAGFYREGLGTRVAVLIDNSLSMSRSNPRASAASSALDAALADARSLIQSLSSESDVEVFVTSPQLRSVTGRQVRRDRALAALDAISFAYAVDHLEAAATRLLSDPKYDRVSVFTDRPLLRSGSGRKLDPHSVNVAELGGSRENAAIAQLGYHPGTKSAVSVGLASFLTGQARVRVVLESVTSDGGKPQFSKVGEQSVTLEGRGRTEVRFEGISPQLRSFRARIEPNANSLSMHFDSLRADDRAWLSVEARGGSIALVGQFSPEDLGLQKVPFARFERISPEAYDAHPEQVSSGKFLAAVFHRYVPSDLPAVSSVFVAPVSGAAFLSRGKEIKSAAITRWLETHPALSYVQMPSLKLAQASVLQGPEWAVDLITSTEGAIAFAGESNGRKYLALGFEILPFEGKKAPLSSILTLNILKYVSELSADVGYQHVGTRLLVPRGSSSVRYLEGEALALPNDEEGSVSVDKPGLIEVSTRLAGSTLHAFNFFDNDESDTLESTALSIESKESGDEMQSRATSLAGGIALLVSLLLLGDLLITGLRGGKLPGGGQT